MPLVKDTSYREIPYSSETPEEDYHLFMSLKQVQEKISKHQNHLYRCRTVGVVYSKGQVFALHDLDDRTVVVRLSLMYMKTTPYAAIPFTAQLFGFVHWRAGVGPCMYPMHLAAVPTSVARTLLSTMKWVVDSHHAMHPSWRHGRKLRSVSSSSSSSPAEIAGPSPVPSQMCQRPCQGSPPMHFQRLFQPCQEPSLMASQAAFQGPLQMASHVPFQGPSEVPFQRSTQTPFQRHFQVPSQLAHQVASSLAFQGSQMASQVLLNGPGAEKPPQTHALDYSI